MSQQNDGILDMFDREDGALGNGWTDGHDWNPSIYEPIGIYKGTLVCSNATARGNHGIEYEPNQFAEHVPGGYRSGKCHIGIGCAWRDMGTEKIRCRVKWSGLHDIVSGHHMEGAPLIHIVPGTREHGLGLWPSSYTPGGPGPYNYSANVPVFFYGTIGSPPEMFNIIDIAVFEHDDGIPRDLEMVSDGEGVLVYLDGKQVSFSKFGLNPLPIPESLKGSTLHGFAVDTHFGFPVEKIPTMPVIHQVELRPYNK